MRHLFLFLQRCNGTYAFKTHARINGTGSCMCKAYGSSQAAVVTPYAGDDILRSSFFNFSGPVRVSQCRTPKGYEICLSFLEYLFSKGWHVYNPVLA